MCSCLTQVQKTEKSSFTVCSLDKTQVFARTGPEPRPFPALKELDVEALAMKVVADLK